MRTISANLQTHIEGEVTTLATCWRILRADAEELFFTDHDAAIVYDGDSYTPLEAGRPSSYRQRADASVAGLDIEMAFGPDSDLDAELRAGLFDHAEVWTFKINWADTTQGIIMLARGRLGEVEIRQNVAKIELRSLAQLLSTQIGRIYTPECDATLGDARCGVSLPTYTKTGAVAGVTSRRVFTVSGNAAGQASGYFNYGKVRFINGDCAGLYMQVESYAANLVTMVEPMPYDFAVGNTVWIYPGCDRRFATCKDRFSNKDNFRGFPHIPGVDKIINVPANRKWTES
jgi:uncharacterized phage protein (TIGR02218 family)